MNDGVTPLSRLGEAACPCEVVRAAWRFEAPYRILCVDEESQGSYLLRDGPMAVISMTGSGAVEGRAGSSGARRVPTFFFGRSWEGQWKKD